MLTLRELEVAALVAEGLSKRSTHLDAEERDFVRNMINALTLSEDRMPKPHQQVWLLHIRDRVLHKTSRP